MAEAAHIHFVIGEDDYLVENAARRILARAVPEECRATAVETVNGNAGNIDDQLRSIAACRDSILSPPFLDPVKLTWWRNVSFLPNGPLPAEIVRKELEKFLSSLAANPLPANQTLLVSAPKFAANAVAFKTASALGEVVRFPSAKNARERLQAAEVMLPDLAKEEGLVFKGSAAQAFIAKVGGDTRTIVSELGKLRAYLGEGKNDVTAADVAAITSAGSDEPDFWEIGDALGARNPAAFIKVVARLEGENGFGIMLANVAEKFYRELAVYRDAVERGWLTRAGWNPKMPEDAADAFDATGLGPNAARNPWGAKKGAGQAASYTLRELRVARARMMQVREGLVTGRADVETVKSEILRILSKRKTTP